MKCVHIISLVYIYFPVTREAAYSSDVDSETQPTALNFVSGHDMLFRGRSYLFHGNCAHSPWLISKIQITWELFIVLGTLVRFL